MENYPSLYPRQHRRLILLLDLLIILIVIICASLIFLTWDGYSTVKLDTPSGATVRINNHTVDARSLRMRIGSYQVLVSSPNINPYQGVLNVKLFSTTIFSPVLQQRTPAAIASSTIGAVGTSGAPQPGFVRWFDNNTWVVGLIVPGNDDLALHFDSTQNQWVVGFYNFSGYPDDLSKVPPDVASYIEQLESQHAGG